MEGSAAPEGSELSARDRLVLDLERRGWRSSGEKEAAVAAELGLGPVRYYQVLNALLDDPAALAAEPVLLGRLRRLREATSRARSADPAAERG